RRLAQRGTGRRRTAGPAGTRCRDKSGPAATRPDRQPQGRASKSSVLKIKRGGTWPPLSCRGQCLLAGARQVLRRQRSRRRRRALELEDLGLAEAGGCDQGGASRILRSQRDLRAAGILQVRRRGG